MHEINEALGSITSQGLFYFRFNTAYLEYLLEPLEY